MGRPRKNPVSPSLIPTKAGIITKVSNGDYGSKAFILERTKLILDGVAGHPAIKALYQEIDVAVQEQINAYLATIPPKPKNGTAAENPFIGLAPEQKTATILAALDKLTWSTPTQKGYQWVKRQAAEADPIIRQFITDQLTPHSWTPLGNHIFRLAGVDATHPEPGLLARMPNLRQNK